MANVTICPRMPVSISAIHMRDIEWCIFLVKKENLVLGSHIRKYVCMYVCTLHYNTYVHLPARSVPKRGTKDKQIDRQK